MSTSTTPDAVPTVDLEALHRDPHYRRFRAALRCILQARLEAVYGESTDREESVKGGEPTDGAQAA